MEKPFGPVKDKLFKPNVVEKLFLQDIECGINPENYYELQEKTNTSDEPPDICSNTVPEHTNDQKSENWTKYGNVFDISNEISILKHGFAYGKRFTGPEYDRYASPLSSEQFKDLKPSMPYRKSIEIPNSNLDESRSYYEDKSKDFMKLENENVNGN